MEKKPITRLYLETLSSPDLELLAEEYGIDVPEGLSRRFIIGELLESGYERESREDGVPLEEGTLPAASEGFKFPGSYNETRITVLLRNPAWAFAYWDVKESVYTELQQTRSFSAFVLRVSFFSSADTDKAHETYNIPVRISDREQYVLLPQLEHAVRIDLVAELKTMEPRVLARSKKIIIPKGCPQAVAGGFSEETPPILKLSGLVELRRSHYSIHRQSFS